MKSLVAATALALALASPAYALMYTETIPSMGPASLPGPVADVNCTTPASTLPPCTNPVGVLRIQVVDKGGYVDWIEEGWGQNWLCLGYASGDANSTPLVPNNFVSDTDASSNISTNYPVVSIFHVTPTTGHAISDNWYNGNGYGGSTTIAQITDMTTTSWPNTTITNIATVTVGQPDDYNSSTHTCSAESNNCHANYHFFKPTGTTWPPPTYVYSGDLLVWAVTRAGSYCAGQYYENKQVNSSTHLPYTNYPLGASSNPTYPAAPGGEIILGIHIYEEDPFQSGALPDYKFPGPSGY